MKPQFWPLPAEFKRWTPRFWRARVMAFVMALIAVVVLVPLLPTASNATEAADVQFVSPDWVKEHSADSDPTPSEPPISSASPSMG